MYTFSLTHSRHKSRDADCRISAFEADAPCLAQLEQSAIRFTDHIVCIIGCDEAVHFLDASDLHRGLITLDYQDWYLRYHSTGVLVFARQYETLLWDVDRCTGVRCELPPLSELVRCTPCNGAFVLHFSGGKKEHAIYIVPIPPVGGDCNSRRVPTQLPDSLPLVKARMVYEGKERLLMANPALGNATFPPFFIKESDWSLYLLDVNTDQLPKGEATPKR